MSLTIKYFPLHNTLLCSFLCLLSSCSSSTTGRSVRATTGGIQATQTPQDVEAAVPELYRDDEAYASVLSRYERDVSLYKEIEMNFSGSAVLMAPEMIEAYKLRAKQVQGPSVKFDKNLVPEESDVLPVVVTFYTPANSFLELQDTKIWNVALQYDAQWLQPFALNYYRNKAPLASYFPTGSTWSKMYVALFRIPRTSPPLAHTSTPIVFSLHSGIAKADFYWR